MITDIMDKLRYDKESEEMINDITKAIQYYAELTASDLFLDGFYNNEEGVVIAHGRPKACSLYSGNIVGAEVLKDNEPMVFYTKETGISMRDARAYSQEKKIVLQRTIPLYNNQKLIIGVLIQENDVTQQLRTNKKLDSLMRVSGQPMYPETLNEKMDEAEVKSYNNAVYIQEANHRIKNNLQTIASILRMQARRSNNRETELILNEDITRINSLTTMYEMMSHNYNDSSDIYLIIERIISNLNDIYLAAGSRVIVKLKGDHLVLPSEKIQALTLALNELVQNAYEHGLKSKEGIITIVISKGNMFCIINVIDNGIGFELKSLTKDNLGLKIVTLLVEEKLKGTFSINNENIGTVASIQFPIEHFD